MEFKINLLSQVIGQIYEAAHITHTLESIAVQYSFTEKQYNAIVSAMMRLATNKPCKRKMTQLLGKNFQICFSTRSSMAF